MTRPLRPRETAAIAVMPIAVTDRTCAPVTGLEPRVFRAFLVAEGVPHTRIGRRVVAATADVLAALRERAMRTAGEDDGLVADESDDELADADAVLARLGVERAS